MRDSRAFTLVELLVVIAMLLILAGSVGSGVMAAMKNAKISKASVEVNELTNALLAYENFISGTSDEGKMPSLNGVDASESSCSFLLGKGAAGAGGERPPVFYNGGFRDPWGTPYKLLVKPGTASTQQESFNGFPCVTVMPNFTALSGLEEDVKR